MTDTATGTMLAVSLTETLQATLGKPGVWAYAVYFSAPNAGAAKVPSWTPLVENGVIKGAAAASGDATVDIALPSPFVGGKVYFLIQSQGAAQPHDLEKLITKESDINWNNAKTWDFRFDSFEVTLNNSADDVGNLTSVNGFGIPMELRVDYDADPDATPPVEASVGTRGYGVSGETLLADLAKLGDGKTVFTYESGPLKGDSRAALSPTEAIAIKSSAFEASDWDAYVKSLQVAEPGIVISGFFNGAPDANEVWHNAGFYAYELEWDATEKVFWLNPTESSQIKGFIKIEPGELSNSIYSTLGDVGLYADKADEPYRIFKNVAFDSGDFSMNTGENNQWGSVLAQLLTGFTAGFFGTAGKPLNPLADGTVDLNFNGNWDPVYAFGRKADGDAAPFQDAYSEAFYFVSNSYGSGYSDNLMRQYADGGPLISVSQSGQDQNVGKIGIRLFDDSETPTGYVEPVIYNYIDPGTSGFAKPDSTASPNNIKLNFANATVVLDPKTPIAIDIYSGLDSKGKPIWDSLSLDVPAGQSPWQVWTIGGSPGSYSISLTEGTSQGTGQLLIANLPVTDEGVIWYRVHVGEGEGLKTFNLYATVETKGNTTSFVNPLVDGNAGRLAVDGLATIAPPAVSDPTINTFTVNFLSSAANTIDPKALINTFENYTTDPSAPVVGTLAGKTFELLPGQASALDPTATITSDQSSVAVGWTGYKDTAKKSKYVDQYTNKISALNVAEIHFTGNDGKAHAPITTVADIDGQWLTDPIALGNGTYSVTMREHVSEDGAAKQAIGGESAPLTVKIDAPDATLRKVDGGTALKLQPGSPDAAGAHVVFTETHTGRLGPGREIVILSNEALEGTGRGQKALEAAVIGSIGGRMGDEGGLIHRADETVFVPAGDTLVFGIRRPDGRLDLGVDTTVKRGKDGSFTIDVAGATIKASADNNLGPDSYLSSAERLLGEPFIYLEDGTTLEVAVAGSTENTNELAFVRVDLDPVTGEARVGGVAADGSEAFDAAVEANLVGGIRIKRKGDFATSTEWTVEDGSGFYAPVLLTDTGEVLTFADTDHGGRPPIRLLGDAAFAFEDRTPQAGSDRDFNDMVVRVLSAATEVDGRLPRATDERLLVEGTARIGPDKVFRSTVDGPDGTIGNTFHALEIVGTDGDPARLIIKGKAIIAGASDGIVLSGESGRVRIEDGGRLVQEGGADDGFHVLHVATREDGGRLTNDGVIRGDVRMSAGDDVVDGSGRFDGTLATGAGDDVVAYDGNGALQDARLGGGNDAFETGGRGAVTVAGGAGADTIAGGSGDDSLSGGRGPDLLIGLSGEDTLRGNAGRDELIGGAGDDLLSGGGGFDFLMGGPGDDVLIGGGGRDRLDGGRGNDALTGGAGADAFVLSADGGADLVIDFDPSEDMIVFADPAADEADVTVTQVDGDTIVALGSASLTLVGVSIDPFA